MTGRSGQPLGTTTAAPLQLAGMWGLWLLLLGGMALPVLAADDDPLLVSDVSFVGNESLAKADLLTVMIQRPSGLFGFFNDTEYSPRTLREDLMYIELFYDQQGWREAKVVEHEVAIDSSSRKVSITITVSEGPRTFVTDVMPFGNKAYADEEILRRFGMDPGDPLDRVKIREGAERVARLYAENGYLEARVNPAVMVDPRDHTAFIDVAVTENTQFAVGQIIMSGFGITGSKVVRRELEFNSGDILRYSSLAKTQRNLYETSLFRSVFVRQEPSVVGDSTVKDVLIEVREKDPIVFTMSGGYATLERLRGRMGIRNENVFGTGRATGVEGWLSYIDRGVELSFTEPWVFGLPPTAELTLTGEYRNEPSYDYTAFGGVLTFSKRFFGRGYASVSYRHTDAEYTNIDVFEFDEETSPRIRSLSNALSYDTRDDVFAPSRGWLGSVTNEYALQSLGSTNEFFKTRLNFRYYIPFDRSTVLGTNIETGWVDAGGGLADIPLAERLYAGGPSNLRGFTYRSVGPKDSDDGTPLGGRAKLTWTVVEVRRHIWRFLGAVAFVDVGNVFERADDLDRATLRTTPGTGIRIETPVGMLRFDVGFNPWPRDGEDPAAYHISIGHAF